jgi:putative ABC transport system permease protein
MRTILRGLARTPAFSLVVIVSLALGIGANTAIFSILDQLLLKALPVQNPEQLVFMYDAGPTQGSYTSDEDGGPSFSYPLFREMQKQQSTFQGLAGSYNASANLSYRDNAVPGRARLVSGNYFDVLGVRSAMGRLIQPDDDRTPGQNAVAVLSYQYWTSRFGGDPSVLNQKLIVNGTPMTIVGVAQNGFCGERQGVFPDIYVPLTMKREMTPDWNGLDDRRDYWVIMFGRLKPGMSLTQAQAGINVTYRGQIARDVDLLKHPSATVLQQFRAKKLTLRPGEGGRGDLRQQTRSPLLMLMAITVLVLLLACANVANLQLARAAGRMREVAVRLALGASRTRLVRQLLAESCLLALAGGALGLLVAKPIWNFILAAVPGDDGGDTLFSAGLDSHVLLFSLGVSVATGLLFGLYPALHATKPDLAPTLKDQGRSSTGSGAASRFRKTLVAAQIAISMLLLISAGLLTRSLVNVAHINLGIRADHLLTFSVAPKLNHYDDARTRAFYEQLTDRLKTVPGVILVTGSNSPAIAGNYNATNITAEGFTPVNDEEVIVNAMQVGPDYFRTMGMPLLSGREISQSDNASAPHVAVINREFARRYFGQRNPIGLRIAEGTSLKDAMRVIGVVADAKYGAVRETPRAIFYAPYLQRERQGTLNFYLRTAVPPEQTARGVRSVVAGLDSNLPVQGLKTMETQIGENLFAERLLSEFSGAFACLATLLAAIGLYGVLAYNVARRTREIGIRMALGADRIQVRGLILREVTILVIAGVGVGALAALAGEQFMRSILYELDPKDPAVYLTAAAVLALISVIAAYLPARKATSVDPMVALRYE